jgi:hypothetical protein
MSLLEPPAMQDIMDCHEFQARAAASAAIAFAKIAHAACPDKPVGIVYGSWLLEASDPVAFQAGGHAALDDLLNATEIQFLAVPAPVEELAGLPPMPSASMNLRDKPWVAVMPPATTLAATVAGKLSDSTRLLAAAASLAHGAKGVAASPTELAAPSWQALGALSKKQPPSLPLPHVAVMIDAPSAFCLGPSRDLARLLFGEQLLELSRAGLAYDVWLLADASDRRIRERSVYLFLNPMLLDRRQREDIEFLQDRDHLLLFTYAAGAMSPGRGISGREMFNLTKLPVTMLSGGKPLRVKAAAGIHPWSLGLQADVVYGPTSEIRPWFAGVGTECDVVGYIEGTRTPGLLARRFDKWSSVYSAAPGLPAALLASLAKAAAAHQYSTGPARLAAGCGIIALLTEAEGPVTLRLPEKTRLRELRPEGWVSPQGLSTPEGLRWDLPAGQPLILSVDWE